MIAGLRRISGLCLAPSSADSLVWTLTADPVPRLCCKMHAEKCVISEFSILKMQCTTNLTSRAERPHPLLYSETTLRLKVVVVSGCCTHQVAN